MEDEDGEVIKKYDLPTAQPKPPIVTTGLKYMGMGVFAKAMEKSAAAEAPAAGETSGTGGEPTTRPRKKSVVAAEQEEEDDRHIRFTIGGFGRRMTKEDFIREIQKLDKPARRDSEAAPQTSAQAAAKPDPQLHTTDSPAAPSAVSRRDHAAVAAAEGHPDSRSSSPGGAKPRPTSKQPAPTSGGGAAASSSSSSEPAETEVERRRRMAALLGSGEGEDDSEEHGETAAERRRREAALGMAPHGEDGEEDSDDDDTPRVPPSRKSIRFADAPGRGRKRE